MEEEIKALTKNDTWHLVSLPPSKRTVGCKWVFTTKHKVDRCVNHFKERPVTIRFIQTYGMDYEETFTPMAKVNTIWKFTL